MRHLHGVRVWSDTFSEIEEGLSLQLGAYGLTILNHITRTESRLV